MSTATHPIQSDHLCRICRTLLEKPSAYRKFELGDQLWACLDCGQVRKWGELRPWDMSELPLLRCEHCVCPTRHEFLRIA